jgi:uncharacterized membrane protein YphA (DoxX/SURF4 family)
MSCTRGELAQAPARLSARANCVLRENGLPDLNLEKHVIRVIVTPPEVLLLLGSSGSPELTIVAVLLAQVNAVRAIFLVVPRMIVAAVAIVVTLVMTIVGIHHRWGNQADADAKRTQNQNTMHVVNLLLVRGARR